MKGDKVNIVLWALQIVLALKFLSVAYTHGFRAERMEMQRGIQRIGAVARPLLTFIALCTFLGGVSLILPAATGILTWLTPLSATLLALMMLLAIGFHAACRERPNIVVGLVFFRFSRVRRLWALGDSSILSAVTMHVAYAPERPNHVLHPTASRVTWPMETGYFDRNGS